MIYPSDPFTGGMVDDQPSSTEATDIGPFVRRLFSSLDKDGISWAVLRGSRGLPDQTRYDIDLLVDAADMQRAELVLDRNVAAQGWQKLNVVEKYRYRCCLLVIPGRQPRFLPIDFFGGCYYRFYPYADAEYALRHRQRNTNGVWVVPPGFSSAEMLVKELMRHDFFKTNSWEEARRGALTDPSSFVAGVESYLGGHLAGRLLAVCQRGEWTKVETLAPEIRRTIRTHHPRLLPTFAAFAWINLRHHMKPPMSLFVVLLGPDGAGKSTVGDLVAGQLFHRPFKICSRFEHHFGLLPELKQFKAIAARWFLGKTMVQPLPRPGARGSGMNAEHGRLRAMLYIIYYSFDLVIGHLLVRRLRGQGGLIVFARYFYDYYYQKGYRHAPRWFLRLIEPAVPTPDLILHLHRGAEGIYAGKPELELMEIKRQQASIAELFIGREHAYAVDASHGVDATVNKVKQLVVSTWLANSGLLGRRDVALANGRSECNRNYFLVRVGARPLLAFPCAPENDLFAALRCYPTHTRKRKWVRLAMQVMAATMVGRLLWKRVAAPVPAIDASALDAWLGMVSDRLEVFPLQPVFVWPATAGRGRVYVHLLGSTGEPIAFAKLALDESNSALLKNEKNVLERVAMRPSRKVRVPIVLDAGILQGYSYLVVGCAPRTARMKNWTNDPAVEAIVREYAGRTWHMPPAAVERLSWWKQFLGRVTPDSELARAAREAAAQGVDVCRVHGDLNKTNVLRVDDEVWLLDWERSCETGPYLTDLICAEADRLWPLAARDACAAFDRFRGKHWDNRQPNYRHSVLLALAFLHAAEFTPATVLLKQWPPLR